MTCGQVREYLFAFLDNELDAPLSIEVQLHLEQCPGCAREAEIERAIRRQLALSLESGSDIPALEPRLLPPHLPRAARRRRVHLGIIGTAVAAVLLVGLGVRQLRDTGSRDHLADLLIADFEHFLSEGRPIQIASADAGEVTDWLRGQTGLELALPAQHGHCKLVGARKCTLAGRSAAFVLYDMDGMPASLIVMPDEGADLNSMTRVEREGRSHWVDRCKGHTVVARRQGELVYAAVSTLPDSQLLHLMQE